MCLGIPGQITAITDAEQQMATVSVAGVERAVNIACVVDDNRTPADCVGDWVLVHVGFAMSRIDEAEAARTLAILEELGELAEEREAMANSGRADSDTPTAGAPA